MTSSWPWMKGIEKALVDTPIDPVTPEDTRESVHELIEKHRTMIDAVKDALLKDDGSGSGSGTDTDTGNEKLFDYENKHDDLWILRFCLSYPVGRSKSKRKHPKAAIAAAKHTLQFRKKYDLDAKDIRDDIPHHSKNERVKEYWTKRCRGDAIICTIPDKTRGVLMIIQFARIDNVASKTLSDDTWNFSYVYTSEWAFQWLDYITRTTGRMTRSIRFIDLKGVSLVRNYDHASNKRDGKIMNEMEDVYPQLLETLYMVHPPTWMHKIWAIMRTIMPKRIISKVDVITPDKNEKEKKRLLKHITLENLPKEYGGLNEVPPKDWA